LLYALPAFRLHGFIACQNKKIKTKPPPKKSCGHSRVLGLEDNSELNEETYVYQRLADTASEPFAFALPMDYSLLVS